MEHRSRSPSEVSPLWLVAAIVSFVTGGLFAFFGRVLGLDQPGVLGALALVGAGVQALVLIVWYLYLTRPRPQLKHWFVKPAEEPAPYKRWPDTAVVGDAESSAE